MKRFILSVSVAFILFLVTSFLFVAIIESWLLENWFEIESLTGIKQKEWLNEFGNMALYASFIALAATVIWHITGYFFYRIKSWQKTGSGRMTWVITFVLMMIAVLIFGWIWTTPTQDEGKIVACGFYLFNAFFIYCVSSWVLSPATVKYAPLGSRRFAPIGNGVMRLLYRD